MALVEVEQLTLGRTPVKTELTVRAGKSLPFNISITTDIPEPGTELDLSSYNARLQIIDLRSRSRRVLMDTRESNDPNAPLYRVSKGRWTVFFGKSYTSWLPMLTHIEMELENQYKPEDVVPLFQGTLHIVPEAAPIR